MMRRLENLTSFSRRALFPAFSSAGEETMHLAVDATAGNGHDTLFLARLVGKRGRVWAFDVQAEAIDSARDRLLNVNGGRLADRVTFVAEGHEHLARVLPADAIGRIRGATFNLGFLPGSDKRIVTTTEATLRALADLQAFMAPGGVISVHCYAGHAGGQEETDAVSDFCTALPWEKWRAARYELVNKMRNREALFLLEKLECNEN